MSVTKDTIEITFVVLSTATTFFAAFSAWMSFRVADRSLEFQKNYAQKQQLILQINTVISKLRTIKYLSSNISNISDEQFSSFEPLFNEIKLELEKLEIIGVFDYQSSAISKVTVDANMISFISKSNPNITNIIDSLEQETNEIFK
jgi:hypothetical protein